MQSKAVFPVLHPVRNRTMKLTATATAGCECHRLAHFQKGMKEIGIRKGDQGVIG